MCIIVVWGRAKYRVKEQIDVYVATESSSRSERQFACRSRIPKKATLTQRMPRNLQTITGRSIYAKQKQIVEPVFGQIKEFRRFRRLTSVCWKR